MSDFQIANVNGSESDARMDADPNSNYEGKFYNAFVLVAHWNQPPQLRMSSIAADGLREANEMAKDLVYRLSSEQLEAASADPYAIGQGLDTSEVFAVWESRHETPGHTWTREELWSDNLDELLEQAAKEVAAA